MFPSTANDDYIVTTCANLTHHVGSGACPCMTEVDTQVAGNMHSEIAGQ